MRTCPVCKEEIGRLGVVAHETTYHTLLIIPGEGPYWEETDRELDEQEGFFCPLCDANLFNTEEEAVKFLEGGEGEKESS